jgi:hypothetical protein
LDALLELSHREPALYVEGSCGKGGSNVRTDSQFAQKRVQHRIIAEHNHLTWQFKRTTTNVISVAFTYDGATHYVNRSYPARTSNIHELNVAFQMDGDYAMHAYSIWLDRVTLTYW